MCRESIYFQDMNKYSAGGGLSSNCTRYSESIIDVLRKGADRERMDYNYYRRNGRLNYMALAALAAVRFE